MSPTQRRAVMSDTPEDSVLPEEEEPKQEPLKVPMPEKRSKAKAEKPEAVEEDNSDVVELEDLDPETPLFEGGPKVGLVEEWKKQYGNVYVTSFDFDQHFVWRTLSRFEYRRLVKQLEQQVASGSVSQAEANMNNEEAICELCLLFPQVTRADMAGEMAGVASIIAQEVMEASAFVALEVRQL